MSLAQNVRSTAHYDLDLTQFEDGPLVIIATECGYSPARNELLRRYQLSSSRLVRRLAARANFQEADQQDLEQEAVFWVLEAIRCYKTEEHVRVGGCQFQSFLHRVLHARFIDALRVWRRRDHRLQLRPDIGQTRRAASGNGANLRENPGRQAERRETRARLQKELDGLEPPARALWGLLSQGIPLRHIADELQVSYDAAKRRRRKLFTDLQASLGKDFHT
jgi:RNA polymerase sigma factor (sigma-70 family)